MRMKTKKKDRTDGKRVNYGGVETKTFQVETDTVMPWQLIGEPDVKWSWCLKTQTEMGRDLANYFEQLEHEREEFEKKIMETCRSLLQNSAPVFSVTTKGARAYAGSPVAGDGEFSAAEREKVSARIEKAIVPQLSALDERIERLASELNLVKRIMDNDHVIKADKDEVQLLAMRISTLEAFDVKELKIRVETIEGHKNYVEELLDKTNDRLRKLESTCALRADVAKVKTELGVVKTDTKKLQEDVRDASVITYNANRRFVSELEQVKIELEKAINGIQKGKVNVTEFVTVRDKVVRLEVTMRDNRTILAESGGQELSAVVKRIILNMEDKIMMIEKKIEALCQGRVAAQQDGAIRFDQQAVNVRPLTASQEAALGSLGTEISQMTQVVQQLKQDINVSKVEVEQISEQGMQSLELANRLNVLVENAFPGAEEEGTVLSLNRVQVMVATAARQLVAGSKWVTKETFDSRLSEMRSEYMSENRHLHVQIEDLGSRVSKVVLPGSAQLQLALPGKLPKMPLKKSYVEQDRDPLSGGDSTDWSPVGQGTPRSAPQHFGALVSYKPPPTAPHTSRPTQRRPGPH